MKSFNVNSTVKVLLTERGKQLLEQDHNEFWGSRGMLDKFPYEPLEVDEQGYTKFQGWVLFEKLGKYCGLGSEMPFDTVILIDEKDLRDSEKMTEPDYKIEELFDPGKMERYFVIYGMSPTPYPITDREHKIVEFNCLSHAIDCVRMLRKFKNRVFHYVD